MQRIDKPVLNHSIDSKGPVSGTAEVGLILMDLSLKLRACDRGAAAILNYTNQAGVKPGPGSWIPKEILDMLRNRKPTDLSPVKTHFRIGTCEYICRAYVLESQDGFLNQTVVALHLERDSSASDATYEVGAKYHLTEREQEALRGISMGLTSKEVAERMNISPNTVKAFLRLIMIKMGVTTRAGIVAKILQNRPTIQERAALPGAGPQRTVFEEVDAVAAGASSSGRPGVRTSPPRPRVS